MPKNLTVLLFEVNIFLFFLPLYGLFEFDLFVFQVFEKVIGLIIRERFLEDERDCVRNACLV
jgi:hypothetical protein